MSDYIEGYVPPKNYVLVAQKAVVINSKNELLLLKRSEQSGVGGRWDFCGGGLDKDENPMEGIKREIREEAGIEVRNVKLIAVTSYNEGDSVIMIGYQAEALSSNVLLSWEHDEYIWVTKEKALTMQLPDFFKTMINSLNMNEVHRD